MKATSIEWDTDIKSYQELPTEIEIPQNLMEPDKISDYLSELTGFCHKGFRLAE